MYEHDYHYDASIILDSTIEKPVDFEVRRRTLSELLDEYKMYKTNSLAVSKHLNEVWEKVRNVKLTRDNILNMDETYKKYKRDEEEYENTSNAGHLYQIAIKGIEGAITYYTAIAYNKALDEVLPKFIGKQAGPKTVDKFVKSMLNAMGFGDEFGMYYNSYRVCIYQKNGRLNIDLWTNNGLTDTSNKICADNPVAHIPLDAFDGAYPHNWYGWAQHVDAANKALEESYRAFCERQDTLVKSLKIGDTPMNRVYSYAMKLEE